MRMSEYQFKGRRKETWWFHASMASVTLESEGHVCREEDKRSRQECEAIGVISFFSRTNYLETEQLSGSGARVGRVNAGFLKREL
jgi:hypothetical protein